MSVTSGENEASRARGRRLPGVLVTVLALLAGTGLLAAAWFGWTDWRYRGAMNLIETEITAGRYSIACHELEKLLVQSSDPQGKLLYLLGSCELARGRAEAAGKAWARVVPGSRFSQKALEGRIHILEESGLYADAERLAVEMARDPQNDRTALLVLLVPLYRVQGRLDEAARLIEKRWQHLDALGEGAFESAIKLVLQHVDLTFKPPPIETDRATLERVAQLAPGDDRIWLGRANLALRTGDHEEAKRWLDQCQKVSPDDAAVWRARLRLGMMTKQIDAVSAALGRLTGDTLPPAEAHRARAWIATQRHDIAEERKELGLVLAADPADEPALARLAELAEKGHQPEKAGELRSTKAEVARSVARYVQLNNRHQPIRDAEELARLALALGRTFESRGFLTIAVSEDPGRSDFRRQLRTLQEKNADGK